MKLTETIASEKPKSNTFVEYNTEILICQYENS